jgi:hypothetical protein
MMMSTLTREDTLVVWSGWNRTNKKRKSKANRNKQKAIRIKQKEKSIRELQQRLDNHGRGVTAPDQQPFGDAVR